MTDPTTPAARPLPADVAGLVERATAALDGVTPGPWGVFHGDDGDEVLATQEGRGWSVATLHTGYREHKANTDFLKAARRLVPDLTAALEAQARQIADLTAELDEFRALFDLIWKADMRAIQMWQDANPGNDLVWPDGANLTLWLMGQLDKAEADNARLRELGRHISG